MNEHRVIFGDSRRMPELDDRSVHLVVTSPPYWCIKDYEHPEQIGREQSYEDYLNDLRRVLEECYRVLHPGCRAAVNTGDQYLRAKDHGRYRVQPIPADVIAMGRGCGFDFMGNIIWQKISTTNTTGGGSWMGSTYHPRDGHITYEHEYIILFRKPGDWPRPNEQAYAGSRLTKQQRSKWFRGVWNIPPARQKEHIAMFPVEIPRRLILMYSFYGETVLDPFLGSGSTVLAGEEAGRRCIGYEINREFEPIIRAKLGIENPGTQSDTSLFKERKTIFEARRAIAE